MLTADDIANLTAALNEAEEHADGEAVTAYCILRDAVASFLGSQLDADKSARRDTCSHTFPSTGHTAASGGHMGYLKCALCGAPMRWNGSAYVPATRKES